MGTSGESTPAPGSAGVELSDEEPRPFVKWAGGKRALVGAIARRFPRRDAIRRYREPFVGAGALFFHVRRSFLSLDCAIGDRNEELINAYRAVRDRCDDLVASLEAHRSAHDEHHEHHYYAVRARVPDDALERAARFIYLNRTCFNGLYRVNRRGEFNVPMGRYAAPRIVARANLIAASAALAGVEIRSGDFESLLGDSEKGDLVYLDPPYHPLSETSSFTSYTAGGFGESEQRRLAAVFERLARSGAAVILSNSDSELVRDLYEGVRPRPEIEAVDAARSINSKAAGRGPVRELLIYSTPG